MARLISDEDVKEIELDIQAIRNKAIDDFLKEIKIDIIATTFGLRICDAERIAEQLKAGGTDGNSTTDNRKQEADEE